MCKQTTLDKIKKYVKQCDYFGVRLTFNYQSEKKYKSVWGGILFLLFILLSIIYSIISIIQFIIERPITAIYFKKKIPKTDVFNLSEYKTGIAFKIECDDIDLNIYELLKLLSIKMEFRSTELKDGKRIKNRTTIPLRKCNYNDFYNLLNDSMDEHDLLNNSLCPEINNFNITGSYLDKLFQYYEILLSIKNDSQNETVTKFLSENECKFSYFFTDHGIDVNNKTNPIKVFLNEKFIQLSHVEYKKTNLYFNIINFSSYENFIFNFRLGKKYGTFSDKETYELYKGENRYETKIIDYGYYAKIYLRVDNSRIILERRFQKLTELFANISSPLSFILIVLFFLMSHFNNLLFVDSVLKTIYRTRQEDFECKKILKEAITNRKEANLTNSDLGNSNILNLNRNLRHNSINSSKSKILTFTPRLNLEEDKQKIKNPPYSKNIKILKELLNKLIKNTICRFVPCSKMNREDKMVNSLLKSLYEQLDIYNYLRHLQMIKLISYITLHSKELFLFKYLSNPSIIIGDKDFYQLSMDLKANLKISNNDDFKNKLQQFLIKKNKNSRERKIFNLICGDV